MSDLVQLRNPKTKNYVLIDREKGLIIEYSPKKFENVKMIKRKKNVDK